MAYLDVTFRGGDASSLFWKANLSVAWNSAWRRFKEVETLLYHHDWKLRCQLTVKGRTAEFPEALVSNCSASAGNGESVLPLR